MLTLVFPWLLLLLPLPLLIKPAQRQTQGGFLHLPGSGDLTTKINMSTPKARNMLKWLMWALLVLAVARPQWLGEPIELPTKGRDLMVAVDLSGSMQIEDMVLDNKTVDRFTLVQHVVSDFIERRAGDRIGLILFGDHAYLQSPMTLDRRSVAQYLREAQIGLVGKQTAIGESIALAVKRFENLEESNRVLVLLTDGTNNAGNIAPDNAAAIAAERKVTIYTIGVGADVMERRSFFGRDRVNPSMDLDEAQLQRIANTTQGKYFRARSSEDLAAIYQEIDKLEPVSRDTQSFRPKQELFFYPLALALLLSLLAALREGGLGAPGRIAP
ncbi:vWA domain-containing protein [Shewanella litorisediminis]|uniref:VWA domain-containing protein n=1 Tax=Shewanella litorisediminis TaxID=1173586 RepID=A0ABX7FZI6_9GAMM|nr:VWA domain-containing protein [Shewanella litorisediminis]MCL2919513.1 VWA domain-containing protein [Shewanella litorisediminis]QRH00449.1 VWA domain-containing protein [Shewanella litorisediminis]